MGRVFVAAPGFIDLHMHGQDPYSEKIGVLDGRTSQLDLGSRGLACTRLLRI